jgi:hypothetical protein
MEHITVTQTAPVSMETPYAIRLSLWERIKLLFSGVVVIQLNVRSNLPKVHAMRGTVTSGTDIVNVMVAVDFEMGGVSIMPLPKKENSSG